MFKKNDQDLNILRNSHWGSSTYLQHDLPGFFLSCHREPEHAWHILWNLHSKGVANILVITIISIIYDYDVNTSINTPERDQVLILFARQQILR